MQSAFTVWIGHSVVLQLAAASLRAPVPGRIVGESENTIRFRIGQDEDIDIPKSMIVAVEEEICTSIVQRLSQARGIEERYTAWNKRRAC